MSIVIATPQIDIDVPAFKIKYIERFLKMIRSWFRAQAKIDQHWSEFRLTTAGRQVPYRVWLRYGAYLEAQQESTTRIRKH
jgi:hypothetical protein